MKYVLDASIGVKWVLPENDSDKALDLRDLFATQAHELLAPEIFPLEVAHALTKAERRGLIPQGDAIVKLSDVLNTSPVLHAYLSLLSRAVELSSQTKAGVSDCRYLALAEQENCELISSDARFINSFPGYPIRELATL